MMVVAPLGEQLDKPRVISELKKKNKKKTLGWSQQDCKPRISGSLEWIADGSAPWQTGRVEVRDGSLVVLTSPSGRPGLRIPLRHLNLQPGSRPRAFSLSRDQAPPVASFQAGSELEYERWVKTLAIELMRQTPLEAVRFLDILGITSNLSPSSVDHLPPLRHGVSEDNLATLGAGGRPRNRRARLYETNNNNHNYLVPRAAVEARRDHLGGDRFRIGAMKRTSDFIENDLGYGNKFLEKRQNTNVNAEKVSLRLFASSDSDSSDDYGRDFAQLISKCQQVESYVPVREKRRLFESLCQSRRFAQSTENLNVTSNVSVGQLRRSNRAQSLHDLSRAKCSVTVSEICRYFEERGKGDARGVGEYLSRRRMQRSERRLSRIKQEAVEVEEELWRIQEEMARLDHERANQEAASHDRSSALQRYKKLECRLAEEETRLTRLQKDAAQTLKEVEIGASMFASARM